MKESLFEDYVGSFDHCQKSYEVFEERLNILTELGQILRFDRRSCEWTTFYLDVKDLAIEEFPQTLDVSGIGLNDLTQEYAEANSFYAYI